MTFAAMAAWQAWLLLLAASVAAAWIFLIKLRPPRTLVPSLLLWQRVLDESRERTWWERIRRAVSLVVTVAIALMLAFAAVQPERRRGRSPNSGRRLIVLDSSLTMLARTSSGETRWDRAVAQAKRLSASYGGGVALATTGDGLVEGPTIDRALIDAALDRIAPTGSDRTLWPRLAGAPEVHFLTDGALARALEPDVVIHSVFEPATNVAITAFAVRPSFDPERAADAYLEVANFAASPQQVKVVMTRGAVPVMERTVEMSGGESLRQVIPIARGGSGALRTRVEARQNALAIDDEAFAWVDRAQRLSVVIVSNDPTWLNSLLARNPALRGSTVSTTGYNNGVEDADLIIFDRWAPQSAPRTPALYIAPPREATWLADTTGQNSGDETRPRWKQAGSHPVVRGVDPATLTIERAHAYATPNAVPVARSLRGTPLVSVVETPEQRAVIVAFGPGDSNLTSAPAFPVLVGNAIDWLMTPFGHTSVNPGLASLNDAVSSVAGPRGTSVPLAHVNHAALGLLRAPGLYVVTGGGGRGTIAVNAGDPGLSDLMKTTLSRANQAGLVRPGAASRPWWVYAAIAAFVLAMAEWWTWQRRITV